MNNRGQSLVLFVLILPIIVMFLALLIDMSLAVYQQNRTKGVVETTIVSVLDNNEFDKDKIINLLKKNITNIEVDKLEINDNVIYLEVNNNVKSVFGKILNFDIYKIKVSMCGNYTNKVVRKGSNCDE